MNLKAHSQDSGFTLVELLVTITLVGLVATAFYGFFFTNLSSYLKLQGNASNAVVVAGQSQRIAQVLRGTSGLISANSNDLQVYTYFYPSDTVQSQVHYYLNAGKTILYATVTPMTANPPQGTPLTAQARTYTVVPHFYLPSGGNLFAYLDAAGSSLATPISNVNSVKAIQVNLATAQVNGGNESVPVQVSLRNGKTNL